MNDKTLSLLKNKRVALFGAGCASQNVYNYLINAGINIVCYFDNNSQKQGSLLNNLKILPPPPVFVHNSLPCDVIIATQRYIAPEVLNELNKCCPTFTFNEIYINTHKDEFIKLENEIFKDELSKKTLKNFLSGNKTGENCYFKEICLPNQYYGIYEFLINQNEHFLDAGAYVGDSVQNFIESLSGTGIKKIYAFEPNRNFCNAINKRLRRVFEEWALRKNQLQIEHKILCDKKQRLYFDDSGKSNNQFSFIQSSKLLKRTEATTIDEYFKNKELTFIKADIEGAELSLLRGARNTIMTKKPKIAICVYHNINDLIEISFYLKELVSEYKMALRHHSQNFSETVLYCWC